MITPPAFELRVLRPGDENLLARAAPDVFDGALSSHWAAQLLKQPHQHLGVALHGGVVVGMAMGLCVLHADKAPEYWVKELAVAATHRRSGLGRALLQQLFAQARALGCRQVLVITEQNNSAARALYASVGAKPQHEASVLFELDL